MNILEFADNHSNPSSLELIRLGEDETAVIPFTVDGDKASVHYCEQPEIRGYVRCPGDDCLLCAIGKKPDDRILLPVYVPGDRRVGVLSISKSLRPNALFPQLTEILERLAVDDDQRLVVFIKRVDAKFHVSSSPLPADADDGAAAIKAFAAKSDAGEVDLPAVFTSLTKDALMTVKPIADLAKLKGIE